MKNLRPKTRFSFTILFFFILLLVPFKKLHAQTGVSMSAAINAGTLSSGGVANFSDLKFTTTGNIFTNTYGQPSPDIWYKFTITSSVEVSISTCSSGTTDTYLHVLYANGNPYLTNNDDGPICTGKNASIKQVLPSGTYYVVAEGYGTVTGKISINIGVATAASQGMALSTAQNYIMETTVGAWGQNTEAQVATLVSDSAMRTIRYFDGLGRTIQTVQAWGNGTGTKDLIMPSVYDDYGREVTNPLPYSSTGPNGSFRAAAAADQASFYSPASSVTGVVRTTMPWAQKFLEFSPLSRPMEIGEAGTDWQVGSHTARLSYTLNDNVAFNPANNRGSRQVALYTATVNPDGSRTLGRLNNTAIYPNQDLKVSITKDENWTTADGCAGTIEEYKDKEGNVVLKRTYNTKNGQMEMLSTYYVYDDFGSLCFVLPPGAAPDSSPISQATIDNYCYQYRYDNRRRLIEKRIPGKSGWDEVIYNPIDQTVFTQDPVQRNAQQRSFVKYDALGRVVMTGIETGHSDTRQIIQTLVNTFTALWETRDNSQTNLHGYNNLSYPSNTTNLQPEIINYYDDYNIPGLPNNLSAGYSKMTKGLLTAKKVKVLGTADKFLWTVNYYNDRGELVKIYQQHFKGSVQSAQNYDIISNTYSFSGQILNTTRNHYVNGAENLYIYNEYSYDKMGRLVDSWQKTGDNAATANPLVLLSRKTYNELGQLASKGMHGSGSGPSFAQTVKYKYNERGWLLNQSAPLFAIELKYQLDSTGLTPQYNGNISGQKWGLNTALNKQYTYRYDKLNRLVTGISQDNNNERIGYDLMGNIERLQRHAAGTLVDQMRYNYINGSRLSSVVDSNTIVNAAFQLPGKTDYTYDANGNMVKRINVDNAGNNMSDMSYNHLNLPTAINANGALITYTYDAMGNKLKKQVSGSIVANNEYISGINYKNGLLTDVQTEVGRVIRVSATNYSYEYVLSDHLGNGRVYFEINNGIARKVQETDYYAFGLDIQRTLIGTENKYQYNGKEKQDQEKMYDYGARFYDPVIGRWNVVDKLADHPNQINKSPYAYAWNNPVKLTDPDGNCPMCPVIAWYAVRYVAAAVLAGGATYIVVNGAKQLSKNGNYYSSVQDNTSVYKPKLQPILKAEDSSKSAEKTQQTESNSDNTYNRVKVRKGTKEKVAENQPRNEEGQMLDPNTGQVLDPERTDLGHKPGSEWRTRKEEHKAKGSTRKEVIEAENNPDIYQYEDRSSNRSRKNEKKP